MTTSGLNPAVYTVSYFVAEASTASVQALLLTILARATEILSCNGAVSFFMVFALLFCYLCASSALAFALASVFSRPATAAPATFLAHLFFIFAFLFLAIQRDKDDRATGCVDAFPDEIGAEELFGQYVDFDDSVNGTSLDSWFQGSFGVSVPANCTGLVSIFGANSTVCDRPGVCMVTCDRCKPKDFSDVSGWTDVEQQRFALVPTFALTLAVVGMQQGRPPIWFRWCLRALCLSTLGFFFLGWYIGEIMPGEFGTARKPWFILNPRYEKVEALFFFYFCFAGLTLVSSPSSRGAVSGWTAYRASLQPFAIAAKAALSVEAAAAVAPPKKFQTTVSSSSRFLLVLDLAWYFKFLLARGGSSR